MNLLGIRIDTITRLEAASELLDAYVRFEWRDFTGRAVITIQRRDDGAGACDERRDDNDERAPRA